MKTHIVALSGGKDSTAMALRLAEVEPRNYVYICTPTGDELPDMEEHWQNLECLLGQPLIRLHDPDYPTLIDLIDHFSALPNFRARWCTRILKIETAQRFYEMVSPATVYVGLRADEMERGGARFLLDERYEQRFPFREWGWGIDDVWGYLRERGVEIPRRTDCGMCFYQRISEWWNLWHDHRDRWDLYEGIEEKYQRTFMTQGKHGDTWPHRLKDLRGEFERGRIPRKADVYYPLFAEQAHGCRTCTL